jgi:hypothetical protein
MMALRHRIPKELRRLVMTAAIAIAAVAIFVLVRVRSGWSPGQWPGLIFGTTATIIVGIDGLYPLRRRLRWPLRSAEAWLQFHVYGGCLAALSAVLHSGVQWPHGRLGWLLAATGLLSITGGLFGVFLQKVLPARLATELTVEAAYERLPQLAARLQGEADRLMTGAGELLERVYRSEARPALERLQPSWGYLIEMRTAQQARLAPLHNLEAFVTESDRARLDDLASIVTEKLQLDVQYSLQRVLRHWLLLHVPIAYLFMGLLALHIVLVLSF